MATVFGITHNLYPRPLFSPTSAWLLYLLCLGLWFKHPLVPQHPKRWLLRRPTPIILPSTPTCDHSLNLLCLESVSRLASTISDGDHKLHPLSQRQHACHVINFHYRFLASSRYDYAMTRGHGLAVNLVNATTPGSTGGSHSFCVADGPGSVVVQGRRIIGFGSGSGSDRSGSCNYDGVMITLSTITVGGASGRIVRMWMDTFGVVERREATTAKLDQEGSAD
ncbi:hypothetical protein BJ165DRAFT_1598393 [Panaeolus papilionaceus]|nr:hypothetical protein BJ165DRAFT_1598393 [Panaeolus papilionaceus]